MNSEAGSVLYVHLAPSLNLFFLIDSPQGRFPGSPPSTDECLFLLNRKFIYKKNTMTHYTIVKRAAYIIMTIAALFLSDATFAQKIESPQAGPLRPNLGTASTYAIFTGAGAIHNTGLSQLTGDVGQDGQYAFTGFPPGTYTGTLNRANGASALAKSDLLTAWTNNAAVTCDKVLGVGIANGQTFTPAVYCAGGASTTTGSITFDAQGDASAIFIVKIGGALSANAGTHILLANGALATNIYWFVDGAVNIADNSTFKGVIVARGAITFLGTSSLDGRALTTAGAINIASNSMGPVAAGPGNNITVTHPAQGDTIKGGTQNYQITWTGTGIASKKIFAYSLDNGLTWKTIDTIISDLFAHNWNVPDTIAAKALIRITDGNNLIGTSGVFTIASSKLPGITIINPALGDTIKGGMQNYQITWSGTGITSKKIFEYSLDNGVTWKTIDTITADVFTHSWNVPDTSSTKAIVRITDGNGLKGTSGLFNITSSKSTSIIVVRPALGEMILGGTQNYQIIWSGTGITSMKTIEFSLDSGLTWTMIGTITSDLSSYSWNVPDTASKRAFVRVTDQNNLRGISGLFTIVSSKSPAIIIVRPSPGEIVIGGTQNYQITWTGAGIGSMKTIELTLDGGLTWKIIGTITSEVFTFNWSVPDTSSTQAAIRITDQNNLRGTSGIFTIIPSKSPGGIIVITPRTAEIITGGTQNYQITWSGTGLNTEKMFDLSLDGGITWQPISVFFTDAFNYGWNVPDTASTQAVIRITDLNGNSGKSGIFTIKSSKGGSGVITVIHPVSAEVVDGGTHNFTIEWTGSGLASLKTFELSTNNGLTWTTIGTSSTEGFTYSWNVPNINTTTALIRITDANGATGTSAIFTIRSGASVATSSAKGYSISNYPNPARSQTTINMVLPVASNIRLRVTDGLGREIEVIARGHLEAGSYKIPFDASGLSTGIYNYILQADAVTLAGKINFIK